MLNLADFCEHNFLHGESGGCHLCKVAREQKMIAAERERCAKMVDAFAERERELNRTSGNWLADELRKIADAVRSGDS